MTNVRTMGRILVAVLLLAVFAFPAAAAPMKQFSFDISSTVPAGGGIVTATLINQTPSGGNSAINSFIVKKPANATISGPFSPIPGATFTIAANGDLKVNGFTGLLPKDQQGTHTLVFSFNLTPDACAAGSITWMPSPELVLVYTGNSWSGSTFAWVQPGGTNQTTSVTGGGCFTVGGTVAGLGSGKSLVLQNNGGDNLAVSANSSFTFATKVNNGGAYSVSVLTQPVGQTCSVTNGSGTVTGNVTTVSVTCTTNTYTIGGTVTGLGGGKNVVLRNNGGDDLTVSANGSFTFASSVNYGGSYSVTVSTQPSGQTCTVSSGSGTNVMANVTGVVVNCAINTYTIGGTVSGLGSGKSVVLQNNGGNSLTVAADGSFTFTTPVAFGGSYAVTVLTQPTGQTCTVSNGSGSNVAANVTNVSVSCITNTLTIHAPSSATLNEPFTVTVDVNPDGSPTVLLSSSDCTLTSTQTNATPSLVTFSATFTGAAGSSCTITASAGGVYTSSSVTISPILTGVLGCGQPVGNNKGGNLAINTDPPLAYIGTPDWGLVRATNNKDGAACAREVPYRFEFDPTNNTAAFIVPDTFGEKVAVEYVILWSAVVTDAVPAIAYPGVLPFAQVAWVKDISNPAAWKFVPALACVDDDVELGMPAGVPANQQPVMPVIPSIAPFTALAADYPDYAPGVAAKMCVAQEGWTSVGRVGDVPTGAKLRQYWHKIIDYADGGIQLSR